MPSGGMVRRPGPTHLSPLRVGGGEERGWHTNTTPSEGVGDRGRGEGGGGGGGWRSSLLLLLLLCGISAEKSSLNK